jgi:hypothetical protein
MEMTSSFVVESIQGTLPRRVHIVFGLDDRVLHNRSCAEQSPIVGALPGRTVDAVQPASQPFASFATIAGKRVSADLSGCVSERDRRGMRRYFGRVPTS